MDKPVWDSQCDDCGKRFPSESNLARHIRRTHGPKLKCRFCWWSCSIHHRDRLRSHERTMHKDEMFQPAETPAVNGPKSVVVSFPTRKSQVTATASFCPTPATRYLTEQLDQAMPDFADLLRMEPKTPSPLKRLRGDIPETPREVMVPSEQLFSKYLVPLPASPKDNSAYSPSDAPFLHQEEEPLVDLLSTAYPDKAPKPQPSSLSPAILTTSPTTSDAKTSPSTFNSPAPAHRPVKTSPAAGESDLPLDLSLKKTVRTIPTEPQTPEIDCRNPTNLWNPKPVETDPQQPLYDHLCLDPRLFFAGAPSSYMQHPLASTLQEKINLCRHQQRSRYQRRLIPVVTHTVIKEERCYLPDGTIMELRDTWTCKDRPSTEE